MKRKLESENRKFNNVWSEKYFVIEQNSTVLCLLCQKNIACMKEFNLKRHYETNHNEYHKIQGKLRSAKLDSLKRGLASQQSVFRKINQDAEVVLETSYNLALLIAKSSRPFTEGEFIKKCLITASEKMCPDVTKKFENLSLSRTTIQRRVFDLSEDISSQLKELSQKVLYFSLAADESTDISSTAQFMIFFRGITINFEVIEEMLAMKSLKGQTTGNDLKTSIIEACKIANLNLDNLAGITTDGAPAMVGVNSGMVSLLAKDLGERKQELLRFHCIIHQQNLCGKDLEMEHVMKIVISTVNFIKKRALNHRQFKSFLEEVEAEYLDLVYYSEVRWLSKGNCLKRFLDLLPEIEIFMTEKDKTVPEFHDKKWRSELAFLVDITTHLNLLNLKLQGKKQFISDMANHVEAFESKLKLFHTQFLNGQSFHFPNCQNFIEDMEYCQFYAAKIAILIEIFEKRFEDFKKHKFDLKLFSNPFLITPDEASPNLQLELIDLQSCEMLRQKYSEGDLEKFYQCLNKENYPNLYEMASRYASLFGSTYICEQTFTIMNLNKSKLRSRITDENLEAILRLATTQLAPNISKLSKKL